MEKSEIQELAKRLIYYSDDDKLFSVFDPKFTSTIQIAIKLDDVLQKMGYEVIKIKGSKNVRS